ncbi:MULTISPECIES: hypothetical protein [unclassified Microcoleus]|uniref:hypothetical protein n=1 Tax=unclassified Microcoleus TaxID=2642155 RepID=UPI002FD186B7
MKSLISPGVGELSAAVKYRYIDSKETGFFTGIKGFKGFDAVFSSIKPGFYVISAWLILGRSHLRLQPHLKTLAG